jgi:hypothetical protein
LNKLGLIFCFYSFSVQAVEANNISKEAVVKNKQQQQEEQTTKEIVPDKELLLFLSEFSDAQGDWVDPEVFKQTTNSNIELEEIDNEDRPNHL